MKTNSISIDGQQITFREGQTIIQAALEAGIYIPYLCYHPDFEAHGSCKVCTVRVNGSHCSACTTFASDGQVVDNHCEDLNSSRRAITQMLFVEGNHLCPSCEKSGDCELQALGYYLKLFGSHFPHLFPHREVDATHPHILLDRDRCIFCELCVRASREVDQKNVFAISGRGIDSELVVNSPSGTLLDSGLDVNDKAAHVCPVGAILIKNQAFQVPIGQRKYDKNRIDDADLIEVKHDHIDS
ncbi:MAG: (2Fe-2S)-binding protein [Gammaproteobacteria bacterium]|nr:(2Fe-2S)-binding protein [Gammaproteobacteria bacterium]